MHTALPKKYVVFTGVTSGIGYSVIQDLARKYTPKFYMHFIILCRCMKRGAKLEQTILKKFINIECTLIYVDLSDIPSVVKCSEKIIKKFSKIDAIYLNAGIMPVSNLRWTYVLKGIFNGDILKVMNNGEGLFELNDSIVEESGLPVIFTTNVLGHHLIVRHLEKLLVNRSVNEERARIIWTSSMSSNKKYFSYLDVMAKKSSESYASSKYVVDAVACGWNNKIIKQENQNNHNSINSIVVDPGTVITNLMTAFLPFWFLMVFVAPFFFLLRLVNPSNNILPCNATSSFLQAFEHEETVLPDIKSSCQNDYKTKMKICSCTSINMKNFTKLRPLDVADKLADDVFKQVDFIGRKAVSQITFHKNEH